MDAEPRTLPRRIPLAVAAAAAALAAAVHLHTGFLNDDALITARYAAHFAGGDGLVYNPGEPVLGTTTPLWALLLAGTAALGIDVPSASQWLGIAAHGAAAAIASLIFARRGAAPSRQAVAGLLVAVCPTLLAFAGSGMETALCVALLALFVLLYEAERWATLGLVGGLLILTRPDAGLVLAAAAVVHTARTRSLRPVLRAAPGFALVLLPWIVAATAYYGSPLPNSGFAKRLQVEDWGTYGAMLGREVWAVGPALPFALVGLVAAWKAPAKALPPAAFAALALGMHFGGLPGCGWYAPPALFLLLLVAADGAALIADALRDAAGPAPSPRPALACAALAAPLLVAAPLPSVVHDLKNEQGNLERCHGAVGTWLGEHAPRGAAVGVDNIGYIGWRSGLRVVDMLGLVQPATAERIAAGERDFALRHERPELIAVWKNRGNTWKYLPDDAWLDAQGYRTAFEALLFPQYAAGPKYVVLSRVPLAGESPKEPPR
jgi:arabinofuranosyltransferase